MESEPQQAALIAGVIPSTDQTVDVEERRRVDPSRAQIENLDDAGLLNDEQPAHVRGRRCYEHRVGEARRDPS